MFYAKNCLKKLILRHFCSKCRENLKIRVLRTKFWVKSACEDPLQVVTACWQVNIAVQWTVYFSVLVLEFFLETPFPVSIFLLLFCPDLIDDMVVYLWRNAVTPGIYVIGTRLDCLQLTWIDSFDCCQWTGSLFLRAFFSDSSFFTQPHL